MQTNISFVPLAFTHMDLHVHVPQAMNAGSVHVQCQHVSILLLHRMGELQDHMDHAQEQLRQVESDLEEVQGERAAKLKELKQKEQQRKGEYSNTDRFPVTLYTWQVPGTLDLTCTPYMYNTCPTEFLDTFEKQRDTEKVSHLLLSVFHHVIIGT